MTTEWSVLGMWSANGKRTSDCITLHIKILAILIILTHDYFHKVTHTHTHTLNKVYIECTRILLLVRAVCHRDMFRPLYAIIIKQFVINITKGEHKTQHNVFLTKNSRFVPRVFHITLELDTQIQTHKELRICKTLRVCMSVCCHGTVHPRTHHERPDGE